MDFLNKATLWKGDFIECSATIIDKHFVVTAAHCLKQNEVYYKLRVGDVNVLL